MSRWADAFSSLLPETPVTPLTPATLPEVQPAAQGVTGVKGVTGIRGGNAARSTAQPDKWGLSQYAILDLAHWYEEQANSRRVGLDLDQGALDRDLRQLLVERGVLPEFISTEFERVMEAAFAVPSDARALPKAP